MSQTYFPVCYEVDTRVSFQHPVQGLLRGVISRAFLTPHRTISTHPDGLAYVIIVNCQNKGELKFVKQPSDVCLIE